MKQNRKIPNSNFNISEFVVSRDHPRVARGIRLTEWEERLAAILVYTILQPLRSFIGRPIVITSGKRNHELNGLIGGSKNSDHLRMMAVDFIIPKEDGHVDSNCLELAHNWIRANMKYSFGQLLLYRDSKGRARFIHASLPTEKHHGEAREVI